PSPGAAGGGPVPPDPAVLVGGDDPRHPRPLRAIPEPLQQHRDVLVAARDIGVTRVLRVSARGLEEGHLWQRAGIDRREERALVPEMARAVGLSRREAREVIER